MPGDRVSYMSVIAHHVRQLLDAGVGPDAIVSSVEKMEAIMRAGRRAEALEQAGLTFPGRPSVPPVAVAERVIAVEISPDVFLGESMHEVHLIFDDSSKLIAGSWPSLEHAERHADDLGSLLGVSVREGA